MIRLAVVGHPNKGKSSIVATLSHCGDIAIDSFSGTTRRAQQYPVMAHGQLLYELIDTPGFQRPRFVLNWLEERAPHAHQRKKAVQAFTNDPANQQQFPDETQLLRPIVDGAGIIYVVDGSIPYSSEYETEMEILRWTGQPRLAIINPIGGHQHVDQWRQVLDQFFSIVRVFNPLTAHHNEQCAILQAFAELSPEKTNEIQNALEQLKLAREEQHKTAAQTIVDAINPLLCHIEQTPWSDDKPPKMIKEGLRQQYQTQIEQMEQALRRAILKIYQHEHTQWQESRLALERFPLFDQSRWQLWGVDRKKALLLSASAGAATGAAIDLGVGGSSLMAGTVLGSITAGLSSLWLYHKTMTPKKHNSKNGKFWQIGPAKDPQFGFVVLARALFYTQAVAGRTHANQNTLVIDDHHSFDWMSQLSLKEQTALAGLLQKANKGQLSQEQAEKMFAIIHTLIVQLVQ